MRSALQADGIVEEQDVTAGALIVSHGVRVLKSATTSQAAPWMVARRKLACPPTCLQPPQLPLIMSRTMDADMVLGMVSCVAEKQ